MPDIPESVVTSLHEHEDHRFDTDEDQAGDHARLDAAFRAPRPPARDGASRQDERKSTTASVTSMALSSTGTYQVRGKVASGKSAPSTETSMMTAAASNASNPRPPTRFRCPTARPPGIARTGGIDIRAICVARPERKVKDLSRVVTNSYSVH